MRTQIITTQSRRDQCCVGGRLRGQDETMGDINSDWLDAVGLMLLAFVIRTN
jgi:hypothetical protein